MPEVLVSFPFPLLPFPSRGSSGREAVALHRCADGVGEEGRGDGRLDERRVLPHEEPHPRVQRGAGAEWGGEVRGDPHRHSPSPPLRTLRVKWVNGLRNRVPWGPRRSPPARHSAKLSLTLDLSEDGGG